MRLMWLAERPHDLKSTVPWRLRDGAEPMSQKAFGQALDRLGHPAGGAVRGKRWRKGIAPHEKAGLAVDDE
jgi:putative DNA primase/helicase